MRWSEGENIGPSAPRTGFTIDRSNGNLKLLSFIRKPPEEESQSLSDFRASTGNAMLSSPALNSVSRYHKTSAGFV